MKNVVLWDGADLGCFGIIVLGIMFMTIVGMVGLLVSFLLQPFVGIPLCIIAALIAWFATTAHLKKRKALRYLIHKFGSVSQKERMAAGYLDIMREGTELLIAVAFKPLFDAGFECSKDEKNWSNLDKATEQNFLILKQACAAYPNSRITLVSLGLVKPVAGIRVSAKFTVPEISHNFDLIENFVFHDKTHQSEHASF